MFKKYDKNTKGLNWASSHLKDLSVKSLSE